MQIGEVTINAIPEIRTKTGEYDKIYKALEQAADNTWILIPITYDPKRREQDISKIRHACMRWFTQAHNKRKYQIATQVVMPPKGTDENTCMMYVQKKTKLPKHQLD